jgi:hypothetical protein
VTPFVPPNDPRSIRRATTPAGAAIGLDAMLTYYGQKEAASAALFNSRLSGAVHDVARRTPRRAYRAFAQRNDLRTTQVT